MRVISGSKRGTTLYYPEALEIRPTTDRVKENIFNLIQFEVSGRRVLDLFCGSGAMGIEALSRGATHCVFVDNGKAAYEAAKKNIKKTVMEDKSTLKTEDFESFLSTVKDKFSLVFLDPPYHMGYTEKAIKKLISKNLLSDDAIIITETDGDEEPGEYPSLSVKTTRKYGRVKITVYEKV